MRSRARPGRRWGRLVEIYAAGRHEETLAELVRWSTASPRHQLCAANCFMELVNLQWDPGPAGSDGIGTPDLLERARDKPNLRRDLATLWASGLAFRATQNLGWRLLRIWRDVGRRDADAAQIVRNVERLLRCDPVLHQRLTFYDNVWRSNPGTGPRAAS